MSAVPIRTVGAMRLTTRWNPEDKAFWAASGRAVAARNLWLSIVSLTLSFAVWMLWSVVVVHLPAAGFRFSTNQLFWLAALPALSGATLRIFYAFAVPIFGGRLWSTLSTASLLVPAAGLGFAVQDPATHYEVMVVLALLCGLGGGNFASSMAHVNFFFPRAQKGYALGMNAGLGNLGVPLAHALVPLAITVGFFGALGGVPQSADGSPMWLQNAGFMWVPLIAVAALAAWFGMDDLADARGTFADQAAIFRSRHNWLVCWLYLGTFGSFIGYSAAFPLLLASQFPAADALAHAWLGPLVGALARPAGGVLADRLGGARVTLWAFVAMAVGAAAAITCLPHGSAAGSFAGLVAAFLLLFAAAGIGNGSTFQMIPIIFATEHLRAAAGRGAAAEERAVHDGNRAAAAALGFASAISAYGGFVIPKSLGTSIALTSDATAALVTFIAFYITCIAITWWHYSRRLAPMPC